MHKKGQKNKRCSLRSHFFGEDFSYTISYLQGIQSIVCFGNFFGCNIRLWTHHYKSHWYYKETCVPIDAFLYHLDFSMLEPVAEMCRVVNSVGYYSLLDLLDS